MGIDDASARLVSAARLQLELAAFTGVEAWPAAAPAATGAGAARSGPERTGAEAAVPSPAVRAAEPAQRLEELAEAIRGCERCGLCATRTQAVPGEGAASARVLFVGEAPGADEDACGRPFVGRAGQLLTRIIESGMGLRREEVFIANVLKCRPPGNRDPLPGEKETCTPYLEDQIRALRPELVIALGRHAACHLLDRDVPLGRLRGRLHERPSGGPPVLATYHPAYLLRNPAAKADCWKDIQVGMRHLDLPTPRREGS